MATREWGDRSQSFELHVKDSDRLQKILKENYYVQRFTGIERCAVKRPFYDSDDETKQKTTEDLEMFLISQQRTKKKDSPPQQHLYVQNQLRVDSNLRC